MFVNKFNGHSDIHNHRKTQIGDYEVEQIRTARFIGPEKVQSRGINSELPFQ